MNKIIISFTITFFAGISTILGIFPTYINQKYKDKIINLSLSFSAGVMITISILSLIPESKNYLSQKLNFPVILIILIFIDQKSIKTNDNLYKIGIVSLITLIIHNIPEGITTFITTSNNIKLGTQLSIAIALHNIPEGIAIAIPIYFSTKNRKKALLYTIISGFSELFGAIISYIFLSKYINNYILSFILGITAGIMLYVSICELIPNSLLYKDIKKTSIGILLGSLIIIICLLILH